MMSVGAAAGGNCGSLAIEDHHFVDHVTFPGAAKRSNHQRNSAETGPGGTHTSAVVIVQPGFGRSHAATPDTP